MAALPPPADQPRASLHQRRVRAPSPPPCFRSPGIRGQRRRGGWARTNGSVQKGRWPRHLALLSGPTPNTYCAFVPLVGRCGSHSLHTFILFAPTLPTSWDPSARNKASHNMALGGAPLRPCHVDCFPPSPGGTQPPVAWQSPRQLAGIVPAHPPGRAETKCRRTRRRKMGGAPRTRGCGPEGPRPSPMLNPSRPRGVFASE